MALVLMRHPRPAGADGLCYGVTDLPLLAPVAAGDFSHLPPFDRIVSSPLQRCRLAAEAIGAARGETPLLDARLREMDFGAWEGRRWDHLPRAELDHWAADLLHARPHGGESVAMLQARVTAALAEHRARPGVTLIVTHAGVVKAALDDWSATIAFGAFVELA